MNYTCRECGLPVVQGQTHYCLEALKKRVQDLEVSIKCQAMREVKLTNERLSNLEKVDDAKRLFAETAKAYLDEFHGNKELKQLVREVVAAWREESAALEANVPSGEFREDEIRGDRVSRAKERLEMSLKRLAGESEKR